MRSVKGRICQAWQVLMIGVFTAGQSLFAAAAYPLLPGSTSGKDGYCLPSQKCWPKAAEWKKLNVSVGGNLIVVKPTYEPCYSEGPFSPGCLSAAANKNDQFWRAAQPGAQMYPSWEANTTSGKGCSTFGPSDTCDQVPFSTFTVS